MVLIPNRLVAEIYIRYGLFHVMPMHTGIS